MRIRDKETEISIGVPIEYGHGSKNRKKHLSVRWGWRYDTLRCRRLDETGGLRIFHGESCTFNCDPIFQPAIMLDPNSCSYKENGESIYSLNSPIPDALVLLDKIKTSARFREINIRYMKMLFVQIMRLWLLLEKSEWHEYLDPMDIENLQISLPPDDPSLFRENQFKNRYKSSFFKVATGKNLAEYGFLREGEIRVSIKPFRKNSRNSRPNYTWAWNISELKLRPLNSLSKNLLSGYISNKYEIVQLFEACRRLDPNFPNRNSEGQLIYSTSPPVIRSLNQMNSVMEAYTHYRLDKKEIEKLSSYALHVAACLLYGDFMSNNSVGLADTRQAILDPNTKQKTVNITMLHAISASS